MHNLPGATSKPDVGASCDEHPRHAAVVRVQGETDSFGAEYIHMCIVCKKDYDAHRERLGGAVYEGLCGRCKTPAPVFPYRDFDEGMNGPVYYYCQACKVAVLRAEAEAFDRDTYHDFLD